MVGSAQRQQIVDEYCRTRSRQTADAVVEAYWPLLRQWTYRCRSERVPTDDILQIAACGLLKSLTRFDPRRASFDTYARHCVVGEVRHYLRDHAGMVQAPRSMWEHGVAPIVQSLDAMLNDVDDDHPTRQIGRDEPGVARADDRARLWELMRDLNPRQGSALLLWVGFQLPRQTVADVLGVPLNTVSRLCSGALRTLRARAASQPHTNPI